MATYKVPQDVEAEDKLIGPFSFRQFVYLIIVALAGGLAWGLSQIFIGLAIFPLPIILLFGALALPLRKDQPMEIYLAAIISFYRKPHRRLWDPDGVESLIEITAPKVVEAPRTKNISQSDAEERFSYLADIVDSQGWAIRGAGPMATNSAMNADVYIEAQQTQDLLDTNNSVAQSFDYMISKSAEKVREEALERMRAPQSGPTTPPNATFAIPAAPTFDPYPSSIQQTVIQPLDDISQTSTISDDMAAALAGTSTPPADEPIIPPTPPSDTPVSADIMNLASTTDLSIETIAHQAARLQEKDEDLQEGAVISLH